MAIYELDGVAPQIDPEAWIAPGAHIMGDVRIEAGASVWFGAVLRGDVEPIIVGRGSNIQENAVLHTDLGYPLRIGANCTIGHRAMLHGCTLGEHTLIGMGATVLNGAVLGAGCLVGAAALVTEGKEFEGGAMILGAPAKQVRALNEAAQAGLAASAEHYQQNAARFRSGLRRID